MGRKVIGVVLLIAGIVLLLFGFSYINSPQYKMMSVVNGFTGSSDPTGNVAIAIGAVSSIVGLVLLVVGPAGRRREVPVTKKSNMATDFDADYPSVRPEAHVEGPSAPVEAAFERFDDKTLTSPSTAQGNAAAHYPHLIYAGAGLLAVIIVVVGAVVMSMRDRNPSTPSTVASAPASASTANVASRKQPIRENLILSADEMWMDTGIDLSPGDRLSISAYGQWSNSGNQKFIGADGWNESAWPGVILESTNPASLIGKVGSRIFAIGSNFSGSSSGSGRLFLSMNDKPANFDDNFGSLNISIAVNADSPNVRKNNDSEMRQLQDTLINEAERLHNEGMRGK